MEKCGLGEPFHAQPCVGGLLCFFANKKPEKIFFFRNLFYSQAVSICFPCYLFLNFNFFKTFNQVACEYAKQEPHESLFLRQYLRRWQWQRYEMFAELTMTMGNATLADLFEMSESNKKNEGLMNWLIERRMQNINFFFLQRIVVMASWIAYWSEKKAVWRKWIFHRMWTGMEM